jgi:UV radiation resistance-associated gene protein
LIFHLIDGIYAVDVPSKLPKPKPSQPLPTSSYNALMRLSSLDDSIQDALATRESLATQINAILQKTPEDGSSQAVEEAALATRYLVAERKLLKHALKERSELKASLSARKKAIEDGKAVQARVQEDVNNAREKLRQCLGLVQQTTEEIHGQRRRICEELLHIFPIEPTNQPLLFTINGLPLQNSSFDDSDEDVVGAALGYAASLVDLLQYYLAVPLPYPVVPYGSRSIIQDQISTLADSQRTFPLYTKGTIRFRFDYGVFLLNKNIECLAESQGLKVIDIRHTLPNLKYLLYVCSAGSSELPARKAGGIRGLLAGRVTPLQPRGSEDIARGDAVRKALDTGGNGNDNDNAALKNGMSPIFPFAPDEITTLRTRGLRENVVR